MLGTRADLDLEVSRSLKGVPVAVTIAALPLDPLEDPNHRFGYDYWNRKRGRYFAPGRDDIEPSEIGPILSRVMLVDVLDGGRDFRYRLSGTGVTEMLGRELTHTRPLDLTPADYGQCVHRTYAQCVNEKAPLLHEICFATEDARLPYLRMVLPLSGDKAAVNMLMVIDGSSHSAAAFREFFNALK